MPTTTNTINIVKCRVSDELDREAEELGNKWFGEYRISIKALSDERRAVYDEIKGMSPEPQVIELKRPRVRTEETENADGNKLETRTGHLMSDGDGNFPGLSEFPNDIGLTQ